MLNLNLLNLLYLRQMHLSIRLSAWNDNVNIKIVVLWRFKHSKVKNIVILCKNIVINISLTPLKDKCGNPFLLYSALLHKPIGLYGDARILDGLVDRTDTVLGEVQGLKFDVQIGARTRNVQRDTGPEAPLWPTELAQH